MTLRLTAIAILALTLTTHAQTPSDDDRKSWTAITHKLEATPLDEDTVHDARLAVAQIAVSHDFHVVLCADFYNDFNDSKYEHHAEIRFLYLLGAATYQIETGKSDSEGTTLYALHSVLKGYASILKTEPRATDKLLDSLAKSDAKNQLPSVIAKKSCTTPKP